VAIQICLKNGKSAYYFGSEHLNVKILEDSQTFKKNLDQNNSKIFFVCFPSFFVSFPLRLINVMNFVFYLLYLELQQLEKGDYI
jgi:hypothetical protein